MPVFLLSICIVAAIVLVVYASIVWIPKLRKDNKIKSKKGGLTLRGQSLEYKILGFLVIEGRKYYRKKKTMDVPRIKVISKFNLMPDDLKSIVSSMEEKNLVTSDIENIAITPFGIEYYISFIKPKWKK